MKNSRHGIAVPLKLIIGFIFTGILVISIISIMMAMGAQKPDSVQGIGSDSNRSLMNESYTIGVQAYIYGLAPVIMQQTEQAMTTMQVPAHAPVNHFGHVRQLATPNDTIIVSPNSDTLYSSAWLELGKEPMILHVPDTDGRYYVMQMLDAYTNTFAYVGKRVTGTQEGNYAIVGPDWNGSLPRGVNEIRSPTNTVWVIGRILVNGQNDISNVTALQDQLTLTPLSQYGKPAEDMSGSPGDADKLQPSASAQEKLKFFEELRVALKNNPPPKGEEALMAVFGTIGLTRNETPYGSDLIPAVADGLAQAIPVGQEIINSSWKNLKGNNNGWAYTTDVGAYGFDYLARAAVAEGGLGANLPEEAVYPKAQTDNEGMPLNGAHNYVIHFEKGKTPPVDAFWSLTMYNASSFMLVDNPLNRYAIGDRTQGLTYNPDGSLDIYIQHDAPLERSNWLPAPEGDFYLILRMYEPKAEMLDGTYQIPPVKRVT